MGEGKHAPWKITNFADGTVGVHAPDGNGGWVEVATLPGRFAVDHARLIAAAPELLETASEVMRLLDKHGPSIVPHLLDNDDNAGQRLRDTIAKAMGA